MRAIITFKDRMDSTVWGIKSVEPPEGVFVVTGDDGSKLYFPANAVECVRVDEGKGQPLPLGMAIDLGMAR